MKRAFPLPISASVFSLRIYRRRRKLRSADSDFTNSILTEKILQRGDSPDAVILGLGTNDAAYLERHPEYAKQFSSDYADFLRYVRQKRPNAYIVCVYGMMGRNVQIDAGIMQAIENLNDEKISYLSTFEKNNVGADGHPSFVAQKEYSEILSEYLTSLLWTTEA